MMQATSKLLRSSRAAVPARMPFVRPRHNTSRQISASSGAQPGDFVAVHYTGTLDDGTVFDSSRQPGRDPLDFIVGGGRMIKGFDKAVTGLSVGETRKVRLEPTEAYGEVDPQRVISFPASQAPEGLQAGMQVQLSNGMVATVASMTAETLTLDLNHELAGKHLNFDVELMRHCAGGSMQRVAFGAGCFWGPELAFQRTPGVLMTEVGYTNGTTQKPSYEDVCSGNTGHAEVVQVTYDPDEVSFSQLLDVFWDKHDPTSLNRQGGDVGTQYRSGIYCSTAEQLAEAESSKAAAQSRFSSPIVTEVVMVDNYNTAEEYHQQYLAKGGRFGRPQSPKKGCNDPIRCYG